MAPSKFDQAVRSMLTKPADVVAGSFKLTSSENFDAFLQKLGVSYLTRTVANKSTPTIDVTVKGDGNISMKQSSLVSTSTTDFKIGEPFKETTADGRLCDSRITLEAPNILKHEMKGTNGGKDSICVREFLPNGMKVICECEGITTTRIYERSK